MLAQLIALQYEVAELPALLMLSPNGKHTLTAPLAGAAALATRGLAGQTTGGGGAEGGGHGGGSALVALLMSVDEEVVRSRRMAQKMSTMGDLIGRVPDSIAASKYMRVPT